MKEQIAELVSLLKGNSLFTDVMGEGAECKLYPLVAAEGAGSVFAVYIVGSEPVTKDGRRFDFGLQLFFPKDKFTQMIEFTETVQSILEVKYDMGPTSTDAQVVKEMVIGIYSTINFNI